MAGSKSMKDQLTSLRGQITTKKRSQLKDPTPSPMRWIKDGEDHYNLWDCAETPLGSFLAHSSLYGFKHKLFGKFVSIETFWNYIQSEEKDDQIRVMHGPTLKHFVKKLTMNKVKNFRAIIMDANWQKIRQHKEYMDMMAQSSLPFDCYFFNESTKLRMRPSFFKWLNMGFEEIRSALKEGREPVFDFLLDVPGSDIYEFVIAKTPKPATPAVISESPSSQPDEAA